MNLLKEKYPEIFSQINIEKTLEKYPDLDIDKIGVFSHKKIFWNCQNNHIYEQAVVCKTKMHQGCGICYKEKLKQNLLKDKYPEIFSQINIEETKKVYPELDINLLTCSSTLNIFWNCQEGHVYRQIVENKVNKFYDCPYCGNKKILSGYNDLKTWCIQNNRQDILDEWDYNKNIISPSEILYGSHKKVFWKCKHNHSYSQRVVDKTKYFKKCPKCSNKISVPQILFYELIRKYVDSTAVLNYKINNWELDIFLPTKNICVEYDGIQYHSSDNRIKTDIRKSFDISKNYQVIRIKEVIEDYVNIFPNNDKIQILTISNIRNKKYFERIQDIFIELFSVKIDLQVIIKLYKDIIKNKSKYVK